MKNKFKVVGLMSGTSLDGLDVALCEFTEAGGEWRYRLVAAEVVRYSKQWTAKLSGAATLEGEGLIALDHEYGAFLGGVTARFLADNGLRADFVSSHGHTVFHQPARAFTFQIGDGNAIHAKSGLPVICDYRSLDVALGGEGAPLVPAGDKFLFGDYDACLNLGGIANISMDVGRSRRAFDVCFCNMALNYLMASRGKTFDRNGALAAAGTVDRALLKSMTRIYNRLRKKRPSLGRELFEKEVVPLLADDAVSLENRLATVVESVALEVTLALQESRKRSLLVTGGGAFNAFLVSRLLEHSGDQTSIILPDEEVIKFKEAIVFGFLGVLRFRGKVNCLASVTGASRDSSSGVMIGFRPD